MNDFTDDFLQGQNDCRDGIEHKAGKSAAYDDGYSTQYQAEQILTDMGLMQSRKMGMRV
jgi:hypothetical protein